MPGDVIDAEVYAKYIDTNSSNWTTALANLVTQINANTAGVVIDGTQYATSTASFPASMLGHQTTTNNGAPRAYLNWLVFDRNYVFVTGGFTQITTAAKETGTDIAHEKLQMPAPITITQPGYVYIYLSNENTTQVEVFFDEFKVTHTKSPVIQTDDYYPFGLTFNSYQRENGLANNFVKFQSQEHVDDLALNWDSFKWRNHQPDIGRFFNIDPLAEKYVYNSPYAFSENQVVAHRELEGLEKVLITASEFIAEQNQFGTVYNKNFKDAPEGRTDAKILNSKVETSNGYVLTKRTDETGNSDNMFEEMFQFFATGNDEHFDYSIIGSDTKSGSKIEGNIEDAEFSIEISIDKNVMTFTSQLSGGDIDKAYSIKIGSARFEVPGFTIGTLKADRKKGEVSTNKVSISFTIDEKGNAEFDRKNLEEKDKAESTVQR